MSPQRVTVHPTLSSGGIVNSRHWYPVKRMNLGTTCSTSILQGMVCFPWKYGAGQGKVPLSTTSSFDGTICHGSGRVSFLLVFQGVWMQKFESNRCSRQADQKYDAHDSHGTSARGGPRVQKTIDNAGSWIRRVHGTASCGRNPILFLPER